MTTLKGGPELMTFLQAFPERIQKGALRSGIRAAAAPIRDQARLLAPKETGQMAKSIKTGSPNLQDGVLSVKIRLKGPHAFLGVFHEYGVRPHVIRAKGSDTVTPKGANAVTVGGTILSSRIANRKGRSEGFSEEGGALKIGGEFVSGAVMHPGHSARPFMRPALDMKADEAVNAFGAKVRAYLSSKTGFTAPDTLEVDEAA